MTALQATSARPTVRPVLLVILDGFGWRIERAPDNAIAAADMPTWQSLLRDYAHTTIDASESHVGLPAGQMGNSEVGHLNMGAGRVVHQDLTRIDAAIERGEFALNPALNDAIVTSRRNGRTLHVLGLVSPGGVHSHERHIVALVELAAAKGVRRVLVHAFLDGRDTPPSSAAASLVMLDAACKKVRAPGVSARIASICGRYYAMDRDQRWERIAPAYELIVEGVANYSAPSPQRALEAAYARGETDEFVAPTAIPSPYDTTSRVEAGDVIVFMNFRADRARQLTRALTSAEFDGFERSRVPPLDRFVMLTSYGAAFAHLSTAFEPQVVDNGLGEYVAALGLKQLRIAETEKYAHVTYFFNGGSESVYEGEDRILVPSPKVATYDQQPEMSAPEVTDRLVASINAGRHDVIICNYANADMVGHTGNFAAAVKACETLDGCLERVIRAARAVSGEVLITSDHGNVERMHDESTGQPHTAHTLNVVPLVYVGRKATLVDGGALKDIAPTMLSMLGLPKPAEMTGKSLIRFQE
ncbi:MAG TPA: 2,3-bisphosphoglycerate-independent phosphoglycerate mutase [Casimicrobiaceae bacterium]|nr:2,3-bisphosphoglycerate-independent phosphoglycerate mutase [Casimicrobiaceae bacterium]